MKRCARCGMLQDDQLMYCMDCGGRLSDSLKESELEELEKQRKEMLEKCSDRSQDFYLTPLERGIGIAMLLISIASVVCMILNVVFKKMCYGMFVYAALIGLGITGYTLWEKFLWSQAKYAKSFSKYRIDEPYPSDYYLIVRKGMIYLGPFAVLALFGVGVYMMTH